jgi:predicted oxidoreductase
MGGAQRYPSLRAFDRGATSYQRLLGDENFSPNPCIGEISVAPFYAVKIILGDIATYHGLVTDARARVLEVERKPIPGLFAVIDSLSPKVGRPLS